MALFACSFDNASPLAPWTTASGVSIVAGRNANGCSLPGPSAFLIFDSGLGSTVAAGLAFKPSGFVNSVCKLADTSGGFGAGFAQIDNVGDGRMVIKTGSALVGSQSTLLDGFVQNIGIWNYYELVSTISQTIVPVDGTHSDLTVQVDASLYVNDNLIGSTSNSWFSPAVLNTSLPSGAFGEFSIEQNNCIVDDVYIDNARIGDCFVASDDTTITVETSAPDITQTIIEIGIVDPAAAPDITQTVIEVGLAPITITIACPVLNLATLGVAYSSFVIFSGGTGPYTFAIISGALPPGLSLNASTGEISGIPTTIGFYTYTVQVTDSLMASASVECSIQVSAPQPTPAKAPTRCPLNFDETDEILLSCPILGNTAVVGVPYSKQMVVTGGTAPYSFLPTIIPLPPGLTIDHTTGIISGTPTIAGFYPFTIQVIDDNGLSAIVSCSITVTGSSVLSVSCPLSGGTANLGVFYSGTFIPSGGTGPYTFSIVAGSLPTGITLTGDTISGTPTVTGIFNYTVRVTDSLAATSDSPCQINVGSPLPPAPEAPVITTLTVPGGTVGFFYSFQLTATGSTPITWTATGLPTGMSLSTHGVLVGTPTSAGTSNITVTAHNSVGDSTPVLFSLVIASGGVAPVMTSTSPLPAGSIGTPYTFVFTASGTTPLSWSALINITLGMSFDPATATFSWPNPTPGTYTIYAEAVNGAGGTGLIPFSLTIAAIPVPPTPPPAP